MIYHAFFIEICDKAYSAILFISEKCNFQKIYLFEKDKKLRMYSIFPNMLKNILKNIYIYIYVTFTKIKAVEWQPALWLIHWEKWILIMDSSWWYVVVLTFFPFACKTNRNRIRVLSKNYIEGIIAFRSISRETEFGFSECTHGKRHWVLFLVRSWTWCKVGL